MCSSDLRGHPGHPQRDRRTPVGGEVVEVLLGAGQELRAAPGPFGGKFLQIVAPVAVMVLESALADDPEPLVLQGPGEALRVPDRGEGQDGSGGRRGLAGVQRPVPFRPAVDPEPVVA